MIAVIVMPNHYSIFEVNSWIEKWFDIDYSDYTIKQSNYKHLTLNKKKNL